MQFSRTTARPITLFVPRAPIRVPPAFRTFRHGNTTISWTKAARAAITDTPRQAYNKFNEGEFIIAKRTWIIGGILLAGGLVAILAGGGGGGGGSHYYFVPYTEPDDSLAKFAGTKSPNTPESSPYKAIKYFADNNQTIVNKVEGSETNDFSISNNSSIKVKNDEGTEEDKKLVDIIDLNGNILDYAAYLQVGMKARNNSSVINGNRRRRRQRPDDYARRRNRRHGCR